MSVMEWCKQRAERTWSRPLLEVHLTLHGWVLMRPTFDNTRAGALVLACVDDVKRSVLVNADFAWHGHTMTRDPQGWEPCEWSAAPEAVLRRAYALATRKGWLP